MENKIYVENGRTIISSKKTSSMKTQISKTNQNILDEMQAVYDNVEKGYTTAPITQSSCENCPNQSMLASILPLLKNMGGKNLGNIASIMSSLPTTTNATDSGNALAKLLPLVQSLNTKKESKPEQKKIDSFTRADE